jgi:hypothetical protein
MLVALPGDHSGANESFLELGLGVTAALLDLVTKLVHVLEHRVLSDDLEADVDVEQHALLLGDEPRVEARPNLDLVGGEVDSLCGVEALSSDGFEAEPSHHRVEKELEETHVVAAALLAQLHPLNRDLELSPLVLRLERGDVSRLLEGVDAGTLEDEEVNVLLELLSQWLEDE